MLLASLINTLLGRLKAYADYRRSHRELARLDDRALSDLGMYAGHVGNIFRNDLR